MDYLGIIYISTEISANYETLSFLAKLGGCECIYHTTSIDFSCRRLRSIHLVVAQKERRLICRHGVDITVAIAIAVAVAVAATTVVADDVVHIAAADYIHMVDYGRESGKLCVGGGDDTWRSTKS